MKIAIKKRNQRIKPAQKKASDDKVAKYIVKLLSRIESLEKELGQCKEQLNQNWYHREKREQRLAKLLTPDQKEAARISGISQYEYAVRFMEIQYAKTATNILTGNLDDDR
jgi:hypothetical protein